MMFETLLRISIECLSADSTNEAHILAIFVRLTFLISQLRKCIDNDTEDNIQKDCNN